MGASRFKVSFFPEDMIGQNRLSLTALLKNKKCCMIDIKTKLRMIFTYSKKLIKLKFKYKIILFGKKNYESR